MILSCLKCRMQHDHVQGFRSAYPFYVAQIWYSVCYFYEWWLVKKGKRVGVWQVCVYKIFCIKFDWPTCWISLIILYRHPFFVFNSRWLRIQTFRERHLGDLQGYSLREAAKSRQKAYQAFVSGQKDLEIPVSTHSPMFCTSLC